MHRVSSLARRYRSGSVGRPDPADLVPPDLRTLGAVPFGEPQRARLTAWLREGAWPRGHMDIAELEGFLVALIAWPVTISAGAWLPPIWGGRGWRVPAKIAARPQFEEFIALVIGFKQELERRLEEPTLLDSSVLHRLAGPARTAGLHRWGRGFMTALTLGAQGLKGRSDSAIAAVRLIAGSTAASAPFGPRALDEVMGAVKTLVEQRPARGP